MREVHNHFFNIGYLNKLRFEIYCFSKLPVNKYEKYLHASGYCYMEVH